LVEASAEGPLILKGGSSMKNAMIIVLIASLFLTGYAHETEAKSFDHTFGPKIVKAKKKRIYR
jgi:hypothetical protein